ncbi:TPR-like protein [Durotheca rogersii]|uniref:TPR-like protein n=1 Tax=Durotheca rogersii TaxID=419775 RepID=UPI0022212900|nr:TPR-like protein [Durotheca rogersii]KAI5866665.1 TPR-like protein [Durotheca rogersii]
MHAEEITDEIAERLKLSQVETDRKSESQREGEPTQKPSSPSPSLPQPTQPSPSQDDALPSAAPFPALSPGRAMTERKTVDEVVAELKKMPFFMTELEENDDTEALRALAYEGTPLEVGSDFKERGNECFRTRRWADAKEFYTKGVLVLAAEERKRAAGAPEPAEDAGEVAQQRRVLESLYANRAACHLELRNYRSAWLDGAAALRLDPRNLKAHYRSARALLAVGRVEEASAACAAGLALDPASEALRSLAHDIASRAAEQAARQRAEAERAARETRRAALVRAALRARGIRTRATARPPELEDAAIRLVPDPDDARSALAFPAVLVYPAHMLSDLVKAFGEADTLADHLAYVLPPPWDEGGEYASAAAVECYMETAAGGLVRVGRKASLLKTLTSADVEVVDQLLRIYVLPKTRAAAWVREFKDRKAAKSGASAGA